MLQLERVDPTLHWVYTPLRHTCYVVDQLHLGISPDWLAHLNRKVCRFLCTFNVLELDGRSLFLWVTIDPDDLAEFVEERVDVHIVELFLGHVLDVDGEAARIDHLLRLGRFSYLVSTSWSTKATTVSTPRVHRLGPMLVHLVHVAAVLLVVLHSVGSPASHLVVAAMMVVVVVVVPVVIVEVVRVVASPVVVIMGSAVVIVAAHHAAMVVLTMPTVIEMTSPATSVIIKTSSTTSVIVESSTTAHVSTATTATTTILIVEASAPAKATEAWLLKSTSTTVVSEPR